MKGFTLVELLAVIVILAVIALIATPIVLSIINDTKESAVIRSAEMYVGAVENKIMQENMKLGGKLNPKECTVNTDGNVTCDGTYLEIEVNGDKPDSGFITYDRGRVTGITLSFGDRKVITDINGELVLDDIHKLAPGLYDENDNLLISWADLTSMDYKTIIYYTYEYNEETDELNEIEITSAILSVNEDGVLSSAFNVDSWENYSAEYLEGKLVIDESVTKIGENAFSGCTGLTSITIPNSVTGIGNYAFSSCKSLTSVTIPDSVTSIGYEAFTNCPNLTSVTLGNSVTSIGRHAFSDSGLESIIIPNSVTSIGSSAFSSCKSLTSVTLGNSVTSIGENAFSRCTGLTSITIPNSVTNIGRMAFYGCSDLTSVIISNGVTSVGNQAFANCISLENVTIPNSVTNIGGMAFDACGSLSTINFTGTQSEWNAISKGDDWDLATPLDKVINYNYTG